MAAFIQNEYVTSFCMSVTRNLINIEHCFTCQNSILMLVCSSKLLIPLAPPIYYDRINNDLQSVSDIRNDSHENASDK